jgi:hypothetical protein
MQLAIDALPEAWVCYDPSAHRWTVTLEGETRGLEEWRWAPRKHLVAACADHGRLDAQRFAEGFGALCWAPPPPAESAMLWAWIGLSLAGLGPLVAAADAEMALAARLGLPPSALDDERPSDLEPLLAGVAAASAPGWTTLRFDEAAGEAAG